jgi:serine/threonine protein kinase
MTVPATLGRYEVVGHLASGGMAEIFLGRLRGPRGFEQAVVIKRVLPSLGRTKEFVDMFVDEANIVAAVRHPNVVAVHELGHEGEELFLVMEYLEGESIGSLLRRLWTGGEVLDRRLAIHIIAQACAGLHAAHELTDENGDPRDLVHRDVTPQNVFVTYGGEVKVLDFGIAKAHNRHTKTDAGQVKGKLGYMSPEQCFGKPLDRRTDIFALGTLLYELTTSRRLFRRETELETLKLITEMAVVSPSAVLTDYPPAL